MRKKIFITLIKILFILISFELLLWILSWFSLNIAKTRIKEIVSDANYRIVCIGESTIAGDGASDFKKQHLISKFNFPTQLQKIINEKHPDRKVKVINLGISGVNSNQILKNINYYLNLFSPDLVILLAGNNRDMPESKYELTILGSIFGNSTNLKSVLLFRSLTQEIKYNWLRKSKDFYALFKNLYGRKNLVYKTKSEDTIRSIFHQEANNKDETMLYIDKIVKKIKKKKVPLLMCNYYLSDINPLLDYFAEVNKIPYCNNRKIFEMYMKDKRESELLSDDNWHLSDKGYLEMAKNVYTHVIKYKLLSTDNKSF